MLLSGNPLHDVAVWQPTTWCCCLATHYMMLLSGNPLHDVAVWQPTTWCCSLATHYMHDIAVWQPTTWCCSLATHYMMLLSGNPLHDVAVWLTQCMMLLSGNPLHDVAVWPTHYTSGTPSFVYGTVNDVTVGFLVLWLVTLVRLFNDKVSFFFFQAIIWFHITNKKRPFVNYYNFK